MPTSLSSDLDLLVYVSNINDYQPQFLIDEFMINFTENTLPGSELRKLPDIVDRDEFELGGNSDTICYYIIGGNENGIFHLSPEDHILVFTEKLDREQQNMHILLVKATDDCNIGPKNENFFDSTDDTQLKVIVKVMDINDNAPKFVHRVFTGGVSTATNFGTKFMYIEANDADIGENAIISYYIIDRIQMTLTEGLENLQRSPFVVEEDSGAIQLNFDPQQEMKGYFDFMVLANDTGGLQDIARVFIYLLREDQRVRFILRQQTLDLRNHIESFREVLGNVTGAIVNIDEFRVHANQDGTVDKTRTDLYIHLVNRRDNSILEVEEVLRLVDQNTEKLDSLFKEFNVLDTQPGGALSLNTKFQNSNTKFWLTTSCLFLFLLLLLCLMLCINQRYMYHRKLKAATAMAYICAESDINGRGLGIENGRVPNTNKHSMEGSNPMWLRAYENEWYKNADEFSQSSDHDSLDQNIMSCEDSTQSVRQTQESINCRNQNVYQTLPIPAARKLETTEL